jgi:diadenosine tetraphosphate (Ap4A) HIT family hydrolase
MTNETMRKFGYPATLIHDYTHWCLLLRPAQVTLGALILAAKSGVHAFADLEVEAFTELASITHDIQTAFERFPQPEKINYLMLMMVDPHVHFHVLPRYSGNRVYNNIAFLDRGWPGPPDLKGAPPITPDDFARLLATVKSHWPQG